MLILKLILVPALIGGITLAGRRWGPAVAGWLSGFPVVTGPILLFIGIEQGPAFASATAAGALAGGIAWVGFALGYAWSAMRAGWTLALVGALGAWLAVGLLIVHLALPFAWIVAIIVGAIVLVPYLLPRAGDPGRGRKTSGAELASRMAAGGLMTLLVTWLSPHLGPGYSGLLAVFPVMGIVLAAFSHRASGNLYTIRLLRGMASGFYAFTSFCLGVALVVPRAGVAGGFATALGLSLAVHFCTLWIMRYRARRAAS
ncbi:MAG TPA: hypothetical protein VHA15_11270 [Burkholderiales bacterium]|nr:hypothetical protein [Burkholderiales bacterium]